MASTQASPLAAGSARQQDPWTWTGSIARLENQVRKSIVDDDVRVQADRPASRRLGGLSEFANAPTIAQVDDETPSIQPPIARGRARYSRQRKCATCHAAPEYTSPERYDVGLIDEVGNHEFNPPSLRGVSRRDACCTTAAPDRLKRCSRKSGIPGASCCRPRKSPIWSRSSRPCNA